MGCAAFVFSGFPNFKNFYLFLGCRCAFRCWVLAIWFTHSGVWRFDAVIIMSCCIIVWMIRVVRCGGRSVSGSPSSCVSPTKGHVTRYWTCPEEAELLQARLFPADESFRLARYGRGSCGHLAAVLRRRFVACYRLIQRLKFFSSSLHALTFYQSVADSMFPFCGFPDFGKFVNESMNDLYWTFGEKVVVRPINFVFTTWICVTCGGGIFFVFMSFHLEQLIQNLYLVMPAPFCVRVFLNLTLVRVIDDENDDAVLRTFAYKLT